MRDMPLYRQKCLTIAASSDVSYVLPPPPPPHKAIVYEVVMVVTRLVAMSLDDLYRIRHTTAVTAEIVNLEVGPKINIEK